MDNDQHRSEAARLYNSCWEYLEREDRSSDDDAMLLINAFASRHHWQVVGQLEQWICGDWMISRAAAAAGYGDLAVTFARRAEGESRAPGVADWLVASCAEGLARAYGAAGDVGLRDEWLVRAQGLVKSIGDDEDRSIIAEQLASVPR